MAAAPEIADQPVHEEGLRAMELMRHAMDCQYGEGGDLTGDILFDREGFALTAASFQFVTPGGVRFHYQLGGKVHALCSGGANRDELRLYLWGTVFGAVAWLNGFSPLHASAVANADGVIAFTGAAGSGKSTLAAALYREGMAHVCDDTLLTVSASDGPLALPDGKPAKLWGDALAMIGLEAGLPIASVPGKYFTELSVPVQHAMPLRHLIFLEDGPDVSIEPVTGAAKLELLPSALYRDFIHAARADQRAHETLMLAFARHVQFWRLQRPRDPARFNADIRQITGLLNGLPQ